MPYATNQGVKLYWEEHGRGVPVVLIMGLSFTLENWHRLLPALAHGYRVILFDNRGMGRSDLPKGRYSIAQMAGDTAAIMDAAGIRCAHLVGASMGGMIAQEFALQYPTRVRSLVLGCTTYGAFFARWPKFSRGPKTLNWSGSDQLARDRAVVPLLYSDTTPREWIEEDLLIRAQCRWTQAGFVRQFGAILLWNSYRRLPKIKAPTLVVHGEEDCLIPPENGRVVARRIPGAQFIGIPNAGHVITTDQPEFCRALIVKFLKEQEERSAVCA